MSFHILKIAIKMFFSRHVSAKFFLTGSAGETGGVLDKIDKIVRIEAK
jgi:hypothetical protein